MAYSLQLTGFNTGRETPRLCVPKKFSVFNQTNRPRSIYQYSNMAPRLSGQTSKFGVVFFVSKSLLGIVRQKKNLQFWPESLGAMVEYWYIERGLFPPNFNSWQFDDDRNIGNQLKTLSTNRALIAMHIPVHKCLPSPRNPERHAQLYDPMRLVHVAFLWHSSVFLSHSFISKW